MLFTLPCLCSFHDNDELYDWRIWKKVEANGSSPLSSILASCLEELKKTEVLCEDSNPPRSFWTQGLPNTKFQWQDWKSDCAIQFGVCAFV